MKISAVAFDMDGVLVHSEQFYSRRRADFFALHGMRLPDGFDATGSNDRAVWRVLVPDDAAERERLQSEYLRYALDHLPPWRELLNPGVAETLEGLRDRGVATAICSSSRRDFVESFVKTVGIGALLDCLVTGDDCVALKPDSEPYVRTMELMGAAPTETIVVEDSPIGIRAGRATGAFVCALRQADGTELDQREAHLVIEDLREVLSLLDV